MTWSSVLGALLLICMGAAGAVWQAERYYRPLLDGTNGQLTSCNAARGNLEELTNEQGLKLGELVQAGQRRQDQAEQALKQAAILAKDEFAAANRLQRELTGGNECAAATEVIDQELGL
ncbi:hypothetical protein GCM10009504_08680 [Pseudomonas laurentiana]|uniref:Uncharacterized protein n=1 Tax=Pseudomonas laurentiana TaxID=2364649 RepID=A0A6I5RSY6_9PSED|nr:hypothetical protein [Pseudomonas laurentiana]NES10780.1 hypothetical protein [Pseudomonas laurentiana]GGU54035.1 hypothetical protein GCM10009504_08680 [Pseudomonas laurentiana]